jgi:UDP-glucuronate decarboxylase
VIPQFIDCVLQKRPLLLSGDGSQRRSFCHVDDMIEGFLAVLKHLAGRGAPRNDCFNIGHDDPTSIRDLAELIVQLSFDLALIDEPLPIVAGRFAYSQAFDDTWHRTPDISHARRVLGFSPRMRLRDGLKLTLAHYNQYRRAELVMPAQSAS